MKKSLVALAVVALVSVNACSPKPQDTSVTTSTVSPVPTSTAKSDPTPTSFAAAVVLPTIAAQTDAAGTLPRNRMTLRGTHLYAISEGTAELHAIDLVTGEEQWAHTLKQTGPGPLIAQVEEAGPGAPVVSSDGTTVYAAAFTAVETTDGTAPQAISIAAVDAATGKPAWEVVVRAPVFNHSDIERTPDKAYKFKVDLALTSSGVLIANGKFIQLGLDAKTGKELWRTDQNSLAYVDESGKPFVLKFDAGIGAVSEMDPQTGRATIGLVAGVTDMSIVRSTPKGTIIAMTMPSTGNTATLMRGKEPLVTLLVGVRCPPQPGTGGIVCVSPNGTTTLYDDVTGAQLAEIASAQGLHGVNVFAGMVYGQQGGKGVAMTTTGANPVALDFVPVLVNEYGALSVTKRAVRWHPVS